MASEATRRRRILVLDDDVVMRELLAGLLSFHGHDVDVAESGRAALDRLGKAPVPEIILTDLQMKELEGEPLIAALRAALRAALGASLRDSAPSALHSADAPSSLVIGMSGSNPSSSLRAALDAFLSKPFTFAQLEDAIEKARAAHRAVPSSTPISSPAPLSSAAASSRAAQSAPPAAPVLDETIFSGMQRNFQPGQLRELYAMTLSDVDERHSRMESLAAAGDLAALQREAHAIKGLCGMVGAREIEALAASAERDTILNIASLSQFPAACARLRRMLDGRFQSR